MASRDVTAWEGYEWALESGSDDEPLARAAPADRRTPFDFLRSRDGTRNTLISTYQDDGGFGLRFGVEPPPARDMQSTGSLRPHFDLELVTGRIRAVELVYDTTVDYIATPGLVTECLLHGDAGATHLIAAEAYPTDKWHLQDESVVVLPDPGPPTDSNGYLRGSRGN